jgi:hypothetical protein
MEEELAAAFLRMCSVIFDCTVPEVRGIKLSKTFARFVSLRGVLLSCT